MNRWSGVGLNVRVDSSFVAGCISDEFAAGSSIAVDEIVSEIWLFFMRGRATNRVNVITIPKLDAQLSHNTRPHNRHENGSVIPGSS